MKHNAALKDVFGFIKPLVDVHTMGVYTMANLLRDCGYKVYVAKDDVAEAVEKIQKVNNYSLVKRWLVSNGITRIGFSYRLDPQEGCDYFMTLFHQLKADNMFEADGGTISQIFFAGLPGFFFPALTFFSIEMPVTLRSPSASGMSQFSDKFASRTSCSISRYLLMITGALIV